VFLPYCKGSLDHTAYLIFYAYKAAILSRLSGIQNSPYQPVIMSIAPACTCPDMSSRYGGFHMVSLQIALSACKFATDTERFYIWCLPFIKVADIDIYVKRIDAISNGCIFFCQEEFTDGRCIFRYFGAAPASARGLIYLQLCMSMPCTVTQM